MITYHPGNIFGADFIQDDRYDPLEQPPPPPKQMNPIQGLALFFKAVDPLAKGIILCLPSSQKCIFHRVLN